TTCRGRGTGPPPRPGRPPRPPRPPATESGAVTTEQATTANGPPPLRVLVADDDPLTVDALVRLLTAWGYAPVAAADGGAAWEVLSGPDRPRLAILDWMMPEVDGLEVCRRVRAAGLEEPPYLILLTGRREVEDRIA